MRIDCQRPTRSSDVTILVPGALIDHAVERVGRSFRLVRIERPIRR